MYLGMSGSLRYWNKEEKKEVCECRKQQKRMEEGTTEDDCKKVDGPQEVAHPAPCPTLWRLIIMNQSHYIVYVSYTELHLQRQTNVRNIHTAVCKYLKSYFSYRRP